MINRVENTRKYIKDCKYECQSQIYLACRFLNKLVFNSLCKVGVKAWLHLTVINVGKPLEGQS